MLTEKIFRAKVNRHIFFLQIFLCRWGYWSPVHTLCTSTPSTFSGILLRTRLSSSRYGENLLKNPVEAQNTFHKCCLSSTGQLHQHRVHSPEAWRRKGRAVPYPGGHVHHQRTRRIHGTCRLRQLPGQSLQGKNNDSVLLSAPEPTTELSDFRAQVSNLSTVFPLFLILHCILEANIVLLLYYIYIYSYFVGLRATSPPNLNLLLTEFFFCRILNFQVSQTFFCFIFFHIFGG